MKALHLSFILVFSLVLLSCSEEQREQDSISEISSAPVDTLYISATDTIGVEIGEEAKTFAFLVSCGFTPEGNIAVLDAQKTTLQIFQPDGEELMQIGRNGQAPGEYQLPLGLAITGNGYILSDVAGAKLIRYNTDGSIRDELNNFGMMPPTLITGTIGNNYLAQHFEFNLESENGPEASLDFVAFGDSTQPETVYFSYPIDISNGSFQSAAQLECAGGANNEAILVEQSDSLFSLVSYSSTGEEIFRITEEWDKIPLTEEELAEEQLTMSLSISDEGSAVNRQRQPRTDEFRTIIGGVGADNQGRIWVQMGDQLTPYFKIYSATGELLSIAIPDETISPDATYSISPFGFLAYDSDPEDWAKIYLLEITD